MMDSLEYLHTQIELEGLRLNQDSLIASFGAEHDDQPLVIIAQTVGGRTVTYLYEMLPVRSAHLCFGGLDNGDLMGGQRTKDRKRERRNSMRQRNRLTGR